MTVRWAIELRSLFHEQQQYVGVSHPGGTCKIWCYETRNADLEATTKTDWKKTRVVFHWHYPPWKLAHLLKIDGWKMKFTLKWLLFRWHVNFFGVGTTSFSVVFPMNPGRLLDHDALQTRRAKRSARYQRRLELTTRFDFCCKGLEVHSDVFINFNGIFHYKASILGYPYFWNHPFFRPAETTNLDFRYFFRVRTTTFKNMKLWASFLFISHDDLYLICDKMFIAICPPGRCGLLQWAWTCGPGVQDTQRTASLWDRCSDTGLFWSSSSLVAWHGHRDFKWWDYNVQESFRML